MLTLNGDCYYHANGNKPHNYNNIILLGFFLTWGKKNNYR